LRIVIQRVSNAQVQVDGQVTGKAGKGLLILVGFAPDDNIEDIEYLVQKVLNLRIFEDDMGKMNLSVLEIGGDILSVSQFTLYGDVRKGRRPSFTQAAEPERANEFYEIFNKKLGESGLNIETGVFGGDMKVSLVNDGPVTILLDSKKTF
jgi:D-tyrosyl-tRNA(Tyr) deacylase